MNFQNESTTNQSRITHNKSLMLITNKTLCRSEIYVEKCIHLGNTFSSTSREHAMITSSISDLNIKTNNLLSVFF